MHVSYLLVPNYGRSKPASFVLLMKKPNLTLTKEITIVCRKLHCIMTELKHVCKEEAYVVTYGKRQSEVLVNALCIVRELEKKMKGF